MADPTLKTNSGPGKTPSGGARRTARQLFKELEGPVDEHFKQSVAGLSGQLGERASWQTTSDPKAAAEARRAALQAYDLARARRWKTALKAAGAAVAAAGVAGLTVFIAISPDKTAPRATASTERAPTIGRVAVAPPPAALPPIASATFTSSARSPQ